ncbi:lipid storage droplets surface-binding protein 2 isoform X2 [Anoplophora glabripennis]|uniref:Lipid storage droplets surface-binding protein 1 n=1 Tax=Anoplophora glabripennis TaxID=217634 RepID=V5GTI8_ANOGL|nr:lipid storage droplets surface-binding protein 2 isoform X2 [Anoplophora glabripennis]
MAAEQGSEQVTVPTTCMESVNRISKLPVVESTIQTATNIYEKVKDYNSVTNWTLSTAESTVNKAVEVGKPIATPVIRNLEGPIKKVDGVLCSGLDYVENKVPAVKLPPGEIYTSTKEYIHNTITPALEQAYSYAEPAVKTAKDIMEPAVQSAKNIVEPAVEKAKSLMEPALDTAAAIKENVMHKADEYLHCGHSQEGESSECKECEDIKQQLEKKFT